MGVRTGDRRLKSATVHGFLPTVRSRCPRSSLVTYQAGFDRLDQHFGQRPVRSIASGELEVLRDQVRHDSGAQTVARAHERGRPLRSYDVDAHGYGAAENFVRSARYFFRLAVEAGILERSPAAAVAVPRRPPPPERALTEAELADIYEIATSTGNDPRLDTLLVEFLRETAARRGGALSLRLGDLDYRRGAVTLTEKLYRSRDVPCGRALLRELDAFARERGARADSDVVFRYANGRPLTRRRFNSLFDRIDRHLGWTERLDVGAHWIRHTTLTDIAQVSGLRVAAAYAGHEPESGPTIYRYTKVSFEELQAAHVALFGPDPDGPMNTGPALPLRGR